MKKIFMFAAIAAALLSCAKDNSFNQSNDEASSDKVIRTVDLTASYEETPDSKASLGAVSGGKVAFLWNTGDLIKAYINTTAHSTSTVAEDYNYKSSAVLSVEFTQEPDEDDKMLFFFPGKKGDSTIPADGVSFTFPAEQYAAQNGLPTDHNYNQLSAAIADAGLAKEVFDGNAGKLKFKNAFAIVGFAFDETLTDVKKISLSGSKGEVLAGTYTIAPDASVKLDGSKTSYKSATLVYNTGASFASGPNFYIVLAPTVFEEGFTLTLTLADGKILTRTSPKARYDFARSSVNHLGTLSKSMFKGELAVTELMTVSHTSSRNIAVDGTYVYALNNGGNPPQVSAYPISGGEPKILSPGDVISGGTHLVSDIKVLDGNILVCNLAIGNASGSAKLKVYKWNDVNSEPTKIIDYAVPNGVRLGDKFTVAGTMEDGILLFHDYNNKNAAYVFSISDGVVTKSDYTAAYGNNLAAIYPYSDTQYFWSGVAAGATTGGQNIRLFSLNDSLEETSTLVALPYAKSSEKSAGTHGLRFFDMHNTTFMTYLQVEDKTKSYLQIRALGDGAEVSAKIVSSKSFYEAEYTTPNNGGIYGDVNVYCDGSKAYVVALAYGTGFTLYEIK